MDAGDGPDRFDDLKELTALCRAGKLFAVQEWIDSGRRYYSVKQRRTGPAQGPFQTSVETWFHSLIEVFLQAGVPQDYRDKALWLVVYNQKIDLAYLLLSYGADPAALSTDDVFDSRNPGFIRWMIDHGLDLESGWPIARAFENRQREFLGIYLDLRDEVPSARKQAVMALRKHSSEGNLKWVSLLLWAGADPRLPVPMRNENDPGNETEDDIGTALEDAVTHGHVEVAQKFKIGSKDDLDQLLCHYGTHHAPAMIELLLALGANASSRIEGRTAMNNAIGSLGFYLAPPYSWTEGREKALSTIKLLAQAGARWSPDGSHDYRDIRRHLGRASSYEALDCLKRIVDANALEVDVFKELVNTPKLKPLLQCEFSSDAKALRLFAGIKLRPPNRSRKRRAKPRTRAKK